MDALSLALNNSGIGGYLGDAFLNHLCYADDICLIIGYEPADLTVHPPPQNDRGWVYFFRIGVYCHQKFFPKEKVDFVGDIRIITHKNVVLRHNY